MTDVKQYTSNEMLGGRPQLSYCYTVLYVATMYLPVFELHVPTPPAIFFLTVDDLQQTHTLIIYQQTSRTTASCTAANSNTLLFISHKVQAALAE